jgi:hypothetical protein
MRSAVPPYGVTDLPGIDRDGRLRYSGFADPILLLASAKPC